MGSHRWERDETNRIAMGQQVIDQQMPPRRVTDPVTDPETRIAPTPPIRAGPIKYPRDVPPVVMATGPQHQETLGALERRGPKRKDVGPRHGHAEGFRGPLKAERSLAKKLTGILKAFLGGKLSRDHALNQARKAIDDNQGRVLEIARKHASRVIGKDILELPPEVVSRYESLRTQALTDFQRILDDADHAPK